MVHRLYSEVQDRTRYTQGYHKASELRDSVTKGVNILAGDITQAQLNHVYFVLDKYLKDNPR